LSLADFAAVAGMSRYGVLRRFSREVGTTPHAYLTQHRVKRARAEIAAGVPIAEAAIAAGFADQSHLTRAFARQFGVSPGRYLAALDS
jgi:AraC-like DNA-binding protein